MLCTMCMHGTTDTWRCCCGESHCRHIAICNDCGMGRRAAREESDIDRALSLAKDHGQPYMVCRIDHNDDRVERIYPFSYADDPEFEAFGGEVLTVAYPDGSTD